MSAFHSLKKKHIKTADDSENTQPGPYSAVVATSRPRSADRSASPRCRGHAMGSCDDWAKAWLEYLKKRVKSYRIRLITFIHIFVDILI